MARNRKRAKDRRTRRPTTDPGSGRGVATARGARGPAAERGPLPDGDHAAGGRESAASGYLEPAIPEEALDREAPGTPAPLGPGEPVDEGTPSPIEHATPDVELAEAQLAVGRAEAAGEAPAQYRGQDGDADDELGEDFEADGDAGSEGSPAGGAVARSGDAAPASRSLPGGRLVNFLQGSWRELQRVQWPDRRQVMQATGVVIGFVIVAGVFLGLADLIATNVVNFILK